MKKLLEIPMLFDDVQFGIDVRDAREARGMTQALLAALIGYRDGCSISNVECARNTYTMTVQRYMVLCNVLHLNPMHYWDSYPDVYAEEWREYSARIGDGDV